MSKKIFIIVAIVLGILVVGLGGYYLYLKNSGEDAGGTSVFKTFFPFGGDNAPITPTQVDPASPTLSEYQKNFEQKLRKLSSDNIAGAGVFETEKGTIVRYIEKATGHIYEAQMFAPVMIRVSNTTVPKTSEAMWTSATSSLVVRYLQDDNSTVNTYILNLKASTTLSSRNIAPADLSEQYETLSGTPFPQNIMDVSVLGTSVFYLQRVPGGSVGIISNLDGSKKKQIWASPLHELIPQYINKDTVALTTKPEQGIAGYMYFVNTNMGEVKKIVGNLAGLSTLVSPDGKRVLVMSNTSGASLYAYSIDSKTSAPLTPATFPEKCVWSKIKSTVVFCAVPVDNITGKSLISWYKGIESFSDNIWKYDLETNTSSLVENFTSDTAENIDLIKPMLSKNEQYLFFTNKNNDSFWSLDLTR